MNRLADEQSAYLASASHQPVSWHPWGEAPFALARETDRPVLLDIGAAWCHWCHVMDSESYEDPELAEFLNANFVCIKVDRDERPDVDARYQRAVQALTGQGGWPLTALLTPDGEVFYGGTYFPPDGKYGRPGFRSVLERALNVWKGQREKVSGTAAELSRHVERSLLETASGDLDPAQLAQGAERMARLYDWRYGGFGTAPKFPHPGALEFLIARWWDTREPWLREIAEKTLTAMARGGVYDQIGGGFHRYSVDERWIVPHFEKMAYDNAELLAVYLHGYAAWGTPLLRETALGIVSWALEVLADRDGGTFGAAQDADVGLRDDGDYFTWTSDEARQALAPDEWEVARRHWDIYPEGEMHHNPAKNVLWVARSVDAIAAETGRDPDEVRDLLERARARLKAARDARAAPAVDRTAYASWNAMLAGAFLEAGAILGRPDCTEFALRVLGVLWDRAFVPGQGIPHRVPSVPTVPTVPTVPSVFLLDDQAHTASAFLTAFEHTGDGRWLDRGRELVDIMLAFHWDPNGGGLFDTR
ncbi:MAG TPA: thioredoxin domain-containing protein, partial [Gemmatimonadales bacterium]|nr:thioredoxin domain-containing protein [Gemmatimonadales bacterium]